jgi:hypothetical protein
MIKEVNRDVEQEIPEVLLWTPSLRFLFPGIQALSQQSRKEYLDMLEEYKKDLEEELKET